MLRVLEVLVGYPVGLRDRHDLVKTVGASAPIARADSAASAPVCALTDEMSWRPNSC